MWWQQVTDWSQIAFINKDLNMPRNKHMRYQLQKHKIDTCNFLFVPELTFNSPCVFHSHVDILLICLTGHTI